MFRIYISAKALADVYLQEGSKQHKDQSEWFRILRKQKDIYTTGYSIPDSDFLMEDDTSDSGIIAEMASAFSINMIPADEYLESVINDHSKVYENPNSAFFLDISSEEADKIQREYGVICQAAYNVDTSVFTEECIRMEFEKNRLVKGGWRDLFDVQSGVPSNALCIIDRYLFAYDSEENRHNKEQLIYNGLDTVFLILNYALPSEFKQTYHLTIICDKQQIKNRLIFQTLQYELFMRIRTISTNKGYPIFAQLFAIDSEKAPYTNKLTHNRQIVSNYHRMFFLNGINAIRLYEGSEGQAEYTQTVQGELLYSTGLKHLNSACPVDSIINTIKTGKHILKQWINPSKENATLGHYYYADNRGNSSIRNFKNRLFL